MDDISAFSLGLARSILESTLQNFDLDAHVNLFVSQHSKPSILNISRVSYSILHQEKLSKHPTKETNYDQEILMPDVILEQHESSNENSDREEETQDDSDINCEDTRAIPKLQQPKIPGTKRPSDSSSNAIKNSSLAQSKLTRKSADSAANISEHVVLILIDCF